MPTTPSPRAHTLTAPLPSDTQPLPPQKAPQIPVLSPPLETARRKRGARVGAGNWGSKRKTGTPLLPLEPQGTGQRKAKPREAVKRSPKGAPGGPGAHRLSGEGKGVGLHETAARPAGDQPRSGRRNKEGQGKRGMAGERGDGTGERGHPGRSEGKSERRGQVRPGLPAGCLSPGGAPGVRVGRGEQQGGSGGWGRGRWSLLCLLGLPQR